jgi:hypothetical protein
MKSAGGNAYGGSINKSKNTLQKFHLEKRMSTSASSKVKSGESTCSSRNKTKMTQNTTDYLKLVNQKEIAQNSAFYHLNPTSKYRGKSNKAVRGTSLRKSYQVEERSDEDSELSDNTSGSSASDYTDSEEEEKATSGFEDNYSRVIRKAKISSANSNGRKSMKRSSSVSRNDSVPSMSRHVRRHKKIPGSVRKPTKETVTLHQ